MNGFANFSAIQDFKLAFNQLKLYSLPSHPEKGGALHLHQEPIGGEIVVDCEQQARISFHLAGRLQGSVVERIKSCHYAFHYEIKMKSRCIKLRKLLFKTC